MAGPKKTKKAKTATTKAATKSPKTTKPAKPATKATKTAKPATKAAKPTPKAAKPATKTTKATATVAQPADISAPAGVPAALVQQLAPLRKKLDGAFCYGLPHYGVSVKLAFRIVALGDLALFDENDVDTDEWAGWIPFATLGKEEAQFLAIHTEAPYRVGMWEHEDGKIHDVWPSLEDFASRVLASKKEKTPYEVLDKVLDKVSTLVDKDQYAKALELLEPAIATLPSVATSKRDEQLARLNNLWGLSLQGVERLDEAMAAFERAAAAGEDYAQLNIMDMLIEKLDAPARALERARKMREGYLTAYERTWVAIYTALASLGLGDPATAEAELRGIVELYAIKDPTMVTSAREKLEEYIAAQKPGGAAAKGFLAWLAPKSYDAIAPEEAAANRAWWTTLHPAIRAALLEAVSLEGKGEEATDAQIARCVDAESCTVRDDVTIDDVTPFTRLHRARRIGFYGDPETIEPLRALPALQRITINNTIIKYFAWPSRAQRALWAAAAAGDQAGCEAALRAGAELDAHSHDWGKTAFHMVPFGDKHRPLALWLVEQGADPYAGNHGDGDSFVVDFWPEADRARVAAAMAKFGHPPLADSPWRAFEAGRAAHAASFGRPRFSLKNKDVDDGDSLVDVWPKDATLQMVPPKKDNKIFDVMRVEYDEAVVGEKAAAILREDPNIELLPVTLLDHANKPVPGSWYFVNPLAKDCLIPEKCHFSWNHINPESATELCSFAIDAAKVGGAQMFRPTILNSRPMIVTRALADKLAALGDCVELSTLKR